MRMDHAAELRRLIEEEDLRHRCEVQEAALTCNGDLPIRIMQLAEASKARQRKMFAEHWHTSEATADNREPIFRIPFPSPDHIPPTA